MVESGRIDKYSHSLDWERSVYDTIMLDNAVKVAKEFAAARNDTMIIVVADHAHPTAIIGTYDDCCPASSPSRIYQNCPGISRRRPPPDIPRGSHVSRRRIVSASSR